MNEWVVNQGLQGEEHKRAFRTLDRLHQVIHKEHSIYYYEEGSQHLERVLHIFIRMNSGGTVLSYSDLLLSIAVAQWSKLDARDEIHSLVDELNETGTGFNFSKDFVLKAGLMLTDIASVGFKVENFSHENMEILESAWANVRRALLLTAQLAASFGFNGQTIRAESSLLPIAYYLYRKGATENYITNNQFTEDRTKIRGWLIRSLLKASGIWGSGLDTLLTALRTTIQTTGLDNFPSAELGRVMAARGKSLSFEDEEIQELLDLEYGDRRTFALLSLLYPFVDLRNHFHIDHIFPKARFTAGRLRKAAVPEDQIENLRELHNRLGNLQLLEGAFNNEKRQKLPGDWLKERYPSAEEQTNYRQLHDLGDLPDDIGRFNAFYEARRSRLREKIVTVVNTA